MWKHSINFWVYEAIIERENDALGYRPVSMGKLFESLDDTPPPSWTDFAKRRWFLWRPWRWFVRHTRTMHVWTLAFLALLAIDCWILARAI